jgi:hypothetical protein
MCAFTILQPRGNLLVVGFTNGMVKVISSREADDAVGDDAVIDGGGGGGGDAGDGVEHAGVVATPLSDVRTFKHSMHKITSLAWSPCGRYFATGDANECVGLFRHYHRDEEQGRPFEWLYLGKHRSHCTLLYCCIVLVSFWGVLCSVVFRRSKGGPLYGCTWESTAATVRSANALVTFALIKLICIFYPLRACQFHDQ